MILVETILNTLPPNSLFIWNNGLYVLMEKINVDIVKVWKISYSKAGFPFSVVSSLGLDIPIVTTTDGSFINYGPNEYLNVIEFNGWAEVQYFLED